MAIKKRDTTAEGCNFDVSSSNRATKAKAFSSSSYYYYHYYHYIIPHVGFLHFISLQVVSSSLQSHTTEKLIKEEYTFFSVWSHLLLVGSARRFAFFFFFSAGLCWWTLTTTTTTVQDGHSWECRKCWPPFLLALLKHKRKRRLCERHPLHL